MECAQVHGNTVFGCMSSRQWGQADDGARVGGYVIDRVRVDPASRQCGLERIGEGGILTGDEDDAVA